MRDKTTDGTPDPPEPVQLAPEDYFSRKLDAGQLLWHYTRDFNGLSGIIRGELWASSVPYLNDSEEFRYGARVALDTLRELLDDNSHMKVLWTALVNGLLVRYTPHDIFSISFSTEEDDLSQWRAYSGTGPSFSVGFDPRKLEAHAIGYLFQLREVKYEKADIAADVKQELREEIDFLNNAARSCNESTSPAEFAKQQTPGMLTQILQLAPRYKHPKFSAEKEWRLIRWMPIMSRKPRLPRRFRLSGSLVVPYISMPIHTCLDEASVFSGAEQVESPMAAVTIGPSPHKDQLEYAIGDITARSGLSVRVSLSAVPFRNW
jgi:Protein of unknown function (DUF2971)